jgi:iron only hydrogenase large subunit-like protein
MPLVSSECPGWVCYAEKRCGEMALPHMSQVKSGQQLFGIIMRLTSSTPVKVASVMPCYDKKLEAVRPDFSEGVKEVDTVLATHELLDLFEKKNIDFQSVPVQ